MAESLWMSLKTRVETPGGQTVRFLSQEPRCHASSRSCSVLLLFIYFFFFFYWADVRHQVKSEPEALLDEACRSPLSPSGWNRSAGASVTSCLTHVMMSH